MRQPLDVLRVGGGGTAGVLAGPVSVPVLAGAVAAAVFGWTLLQRFAGLELPAYDTAFFEQVVWNAGHGHGFTSGFFGANFLGLHLSPLLALPAALELAWPDARVLGLLNALALGASAPASYLLLRALLEERPGAQVASAALAAMLPLWLAVQQAAGAGFHTEALALPLVLTSGWAGLRGRTLVCWACALVALCAKEDQAYAVAVIGLLLAVRGPSRGQGVALVALSIAWGAAAELVLMPALRGTVSSDIANYYSWLPGASASRIALAVANPAGWLAFAGLVAAAAGLPLLRPAWLALALPPLVADLLSAHSQQSVLHLQYGLPLVVPLLVAGGLGAQRLLDSPRVRPAALAGLALPALAVGLAFSPLLGQVRPAAASPLQRLAACTAALPGGAAVAADDNVAAAFAARAVERPLTWGRPGDWIIVDRDTYPPSYVNRRARSAELAALSGQGRRLYCSDGRFQLWGPASG
jgi:uncharacterized membrane protein